MAKNPILTDEPDPLLQPQPEDDSVPKEPIPDTRPPKPVKRVKPSIEGITVPYATTPPPPATLPKLTDAEKKLIADDEDPNPFIFTRQPAAKISLPPKKTSAARTVIITGIVLILLVGAAYGAYDWYIRRPIGPVPQRIILPPATSSDDTLNNATTSSSSMDSSLTASTSPGGTPLNMSTTTASSTMPAPTAVLPQLKINNTPTGYLNVRQTPSTGGTLVTQIHPGEIYPYTAVQNGWYQINLPNGSSGWVSGQYVTKQ